MDEISEIIKNSLVRVKDFAKKHLKIIVISASIIIIFGAAIYVVMKDTVKNVLRLAQEFTSTVNIGDDGTMTTEISAQDLWNKMIQQGYEVDKYLDNPAELLKLLQTELVTKLPDTRSNVEEPIDWEKMFDTSKYINNNNTESDNNDGEDEKGENLQGVIKFLRHDENGKKNYLTYASPTEFDSWIDEYKNSGSQTAKENALSHFTLKKTNKVNTSRVTGGKRGEYDSNAAGEGYAGVYTSTTGLVFKDYKQGDEPWASHEYTTFDGTNYISHYISDWGCGITCIADCLGALGFDKTPINTADECGYSTNTDYLNSLGVSAEYIEGWISSTDVENLLNSRKLVIMHYRNGSFFGGSAQFHYVAIVDSDGQGNYMVLNPGARDSGWFTAEQIEDGNFDRVIIDTNSATTVETNTTSTNVNNANNENTNNYLGYQAIVATWTQIDKETLTYNSPHAVEACENLGITYENGTTYTMTTKPIDYESMVEPYTLSFDLLWAFLVIGQSKGFVMDWADLAYGSDIVISIYDNLTTTTDIDDWYYKEETDVKVSGLVDYHIEGGNSHYRRVNHEHIYANGDTSVKQEDGHIKKTVVKNQNTLITELTKAHTWIADYDATYTYSNDGEKTQNGEKSRDNYNLIPYTKGSIADDPCGEIQEKIEEIVYDVNAEYQQIAQRQSQQMMSELYDTLGDLGDRAVQAVSAKSISSADVNTSGVDVYIQVNHVDIIDKTTDTTVTRKYVAQTPSLKIKDGEASSTTIGISSSNTSNIVGNTIEEKVWWALQNAGYSKEVSAGVMGNIYAESGFNPGSTENGLSYDEVMNDDNLGLGICGWTFPELKREFIDFAKSRGKLWTDEDIQVEFLVACMTPGGVQGITSKQWANPTHGCSYEDFKNASTPEDATYQYCWVFENPAESAAHMDTRQAKAREYYEQYKDYNQPARKTPQSLENFLFIGDSRYAEGGPINSEIQRAGSNIKILGVGSSTIDEWLNVANNGGRGTVQGTNADITGNYTGISIQLGANSVLNNVDNATSQMTSFINKLQELHPNTPIFVNSCLGVNVNAVQSGYTWSVSNMQSCINQFNSNIEQFCNTKNNVYYIDISVGLMDSNGFVKIDYEDDGLHMSNAEGARVFVNNIKNGVLEPNSSSKNSKKEQKSALVSDNFVTLFNSAKYRENKNNILSATEWLFEIMEENDKLSNMVEIMKYLLYKATGINYGATDIEQIWKEYTDSFKSVHSSGGSSGITGVPGKVYDFLLSKGVPPVGAAAVMGNIENESGFNPAAVNEIGCSGLCQWYQGRLENLKKFAESKGTDWTDVNTQMEFLWKELNESYSGVKDVIMSAKSESDLEYATWYWGSHFEVYDSAADAGFESSKNWAEEKERCEASNKWYNEWQTHHTSSSASSDVASFALQFEGMLQSEIPGFVGYTLSDGSITVFEHEWCAMFASWCFDKCGLIPSKLSTGSTFADDLGDMAASIGKFGAGGSYVPNSGDLIFFDWNPERGDGIDHVAIVVSTDGSSVTWIGGNQGDGGSYASRRVTQNSASLSSINISGYWDMSN